MDYDIYEIFTTINRFLDGLFFGFSIVVILSLIAYVFFRDYSIHSFIHHCLKIVRVLAIIFLLLYLLSSLIFYVILDQDFPLKRATGAYAYTYWFIVLRPIIFCLFLQLFWIKSVTSRLRYITLIVVLASIFILPSAIFMERMIIITASYSRDYYNGNSAMDYSMIFAMLWFIVEKVILFCALVFGNIFISRNKSSSN